MNSAWNNIEATNENALPYTKALPGQVNIEMDNEILQGAQLYLEYTISIKNESEIDYDYKENQNYYYYGDTTGVSQVSTGIRKIVDYMDDDLVYDETNNSSEWKKVTADELNSWNDSEGTKKLISDDVYQGINKGYTILMTEYFSKNHIEVGKIGSIQIYGSKLLSTTDKGITAYNHTEILETEGIRSIWSSTPGNYNPSKDGGSPHELDDDKTVLTITPPTGLTDNKIIFISISAISLVVIAVGIYLIRKKVLK